VKGRLAGVVALVFSVSTGSLLTNCHRRNRSQPDDAPGPSSAASLLAGAEGPAPRRGMVFIAPGALVVGTPPDRLPRRADRELPGEQVVLHGFYVDVFPYPNEEGAIPMTGVTQRQAASLCAKLDKRLCTELEWERACKGPDNRTYTWGNEYRADACAAGNTAVRHPAGLLVGCQSDFGVRDMHGNVFEWTASAWRRGPQSGRVVVRGGGGEPGEVLARCANAEPRHPDQTRPDIGFRCCAGPVNTPEVVLGVGSGPAVSKLTHLDPKLTGRLLAQDNPQMRGDLGPGPVDAIRGWRWEPVGNDEFVAIALCARRVTPSRCGLAVARNTAGRLEIVAWANTGYIVSTLHMAHEARDIWLLGHDDSGAFKRLVRYAWGRVSVGSKLRTPRRSSRGGRKAQGERQ